MLNYTNEIKLMRVNSCAWPCIFYEIRISSLEGASVTRSRHRSIQWSWLTACAAVANAILSDESIGNRRRHSISVVGLGE